MHPDLLYRKAFLAICPKMIMTVLQEGGLYFKIIKIPV